MASKVNAAATVIHSIALPVALEQIAARIAGAMQETVSLSETLGTLTREAGKIIKKQPEMIDPFIDACRQLCEASGLKEGSFKVYMSNIRGVIRAMVEGYNPKDGQSLRSMYDTAPKGTGRQKATGARHSAPKADTETGGEEGESEAPAPVKPADVKRAAVIALFGHCDDELMAALMWAAKNETSFVRYVKANVAAAQSPKVEAVKPAARKAA